MCGISNDDGAYLLPYKLCVNRLLSYEHVEVISDDFQVMEIFRKLCTSRSLNCRVTEVDDCSSIPGSGMEGFFPFVTTVSRPNLGPPNAL
jgi:hypothetical protein